MVGNKAKDEENQEEETMQPGGVTPEDELSADEGLLADEAKKDEAAQRPEEEAAHGAAEMDHAAEGLAVDEGLSDKDD